MVFTAVLHTVVTSFFEIVIYVSGCLLCHKQTVTVPRIVDSPDYRSSEVPFCVNPNHSPHFVDVRIISQHVTPFTLSCTLSIHFTPSPPFIQTVSHKSAMLTCCLFPLDPISIYCIPLPTDQHPYPVSCSYTYGFLG